MLCTCPIFLATIQTPDVIIEPVFFWPDELMSVHERNIEPAFFKGLNKFPADTEVRAAVNTLHQGLVQTLNECKVAHFQLGKCYPYADVIEPENLLLIKAIKHTLDPKGLINPGVLGLG